MFRTPHSLAHVVPLALSVIAISLCGCTFDDQFNDPAWKDKSWIDPEPGEKIRSDRVHGGII